MRLRFALASLALLPAIVLAEAESFSAGPAIPDFGPVADAKVTWPLPADAKFRHSFDVSDQGGENELNQGLVSVARFINMHARAGVDPSRIELAVVVHGAAVNDVSGVSTGSADLVAALIDSDVRIIVCGQSAAYRGIEPEDLLPGVEMALSAMTAHALLQQEGFTLNPF